MKTSTFAAAVAGGGIAAVIGGAAVVAGVLCIPAGLVGGAYLLGSMAASYGTLAEIGAGIVGAVGGTYAGRFVGNVVARIGVAAGVGAGAVGAGVTKLVGVGAEKIHSAFHMSSIKNDFDIVAGTPAAQNDNKPSPKQQAARKLAL